MYKDALDHATGDVIIDYKHVAYADDHLTIVGLAVPAEINDESLAELSRLVILTIRELIDSATRAAGCSINLTKSEVVLGDPCLISGLTDLGAKTEFTWLGYSLKLAADHHLMFTRKCSPD